MKDGRGVAVRVLVAEDSPVVREYLAHLLGQDPAIEVVGTARDGEEALAEAERLRPDVIAMDIFMPRLDGYEASRLIMERVPTPIVLVTASTDHDEVAMTFRALQAGALTVIEKPPALDHPAHAVAATKLQDTVRLMAGVNVVRRWPARGRRPPRVGPVQRRSQRFGLVAIGASTGGPPALAQVLGALPPSFSVPILVVQHIAPGFVAGLADWLSGTTGREVRLAMAGESTVAGVAYLAPEARHLGIGRDGRLRLVDGAGGGFCPSASYLFSSVAEAYGGSAVGVLLTGMGSDGAEGLLQLRRAGGLTLAQDEETSVVFGMPAVAARIGAAMRVLALDQIASVLSAVVVEGS